MPAMPPPFWKCCKMESGFSGKHGRGTGVWSLSFAGVRKKYSLQELCGRV